MIFPVVFGKAIRFIEEEEEEKFLPFYLHVHKFYEINERIENVLL